MARPVAVLAFAAMLVTLWASPAAGQYTITGAKNSILGVYLSAGRILSLAPRTTLTLGATYTDTLGVEPLASLALGYALPRGWTATVTASSGGIGGDYRVDRLPEVSVAKGDRVPGTSLSYGIELGAGNYTIRPNGLAGYRLHATAQLSTPAYPLGRLASISAAIGYRQYAYATSLHAASWGSAGITITPLPLLSMTLSYLRQIPSGTSPLLFDGMGAESTLTGGITFRPVPGLTVSHSQSYSYLSNAISARVYGLSVAVPGGPVISVSWDDVPQTASLSFRW